MIWNPWKRAAMAEQDFKDCFSDLIHAYDEVERLSYALECIRDLETEHANATVKKMARIAQEALENDL
jgi:gamma-glutamyl phosphate reductase